MDFPDTDSDLDIDLQDVKKECLDYSGILKRMAEPKTAKNGEDGNLSDEHSPVNEPYHDYSSESYHPSDPEATHSEEEFTCSDGVDEGLSDLFPKSTQISKVLDGRMTDTIRKRGLRMPDYCFYCRKDVHNFSRHVFRHHINECEVKKILLTQKKSKERKVLLTKLRKRGNFLQNCQKCVKPVKRKKHFSSNDYLPCSKCFGFYARHQLWKHRKVCDLDSEKFTQAEAQNLLIKNLEIDPTLRELVFPRMRADLISLICKNDSLICAFGSQHFSPSKLHASKHFINMVSRKMRALGNLLFEIKNIEPSVTDLSCALKPQYYTTIVAATKNCSKYDENEKKYLNPSFAIIIITLIKQCCQLAITKLQGTIETASIEADVKILIKIIEVKWRLDVYCQAADDLILKKLKKPNVVPLASDLELLKEPPTTSDAASPHQSLLNSSQKATTNQTIFKKIRRRNLVPWTPEQKKIVLQFFKTHIDLSKPPKKNECETLKNQHRALLSNKDWLKIKVFVQNTYNKRQRETMLMM